MKATDLKVKAFHCLLAITLVMGLMVPTFSSTAYGEPESAAAAQQDGSGAQDAITSSLTDAGASSDGGTDGRASNAPAEGAGDAGSPDSNEQQTSGLAGAAQDLQDLQGAQKEQGAQDNLQAVVSTLDNGATKVEVGGYTFTGAGLTAADFVLSGTAVTVNTSKQAVVTTKDAAGTVVAVANSLVIPAGVTANLVFDGMTVNAMEPIDIKAGATLNVVLASGSNNSFKANGDVRYPGIHCGHGATITIDDDVPNTDTSGNPIVPSNGLIPAGTVFVDSFGATRTASENKDNYLTLLDSANPGTLTVHGGGQSAGFGGRYSEDGGNMTFNGGNIVVTNGLGPNSGSGEGIFGPGIGGGGNAAGTSPTEWITINGGNISATAAFHGAGIGGGWNQNTKTVPAEVVKSTHPHGTGNIRINGGYVLSNGGQDGNGFGRGCYGQQQVCNNRDYTIIITGGTMIPKGGTNLGQYSQDIGGAGTGYAPDKIANNDHAANIIITGGSVYVGKSGNRFRFDGTAYGDFVEEGGVIKPAGSEVTLVTIDLSKDGLESNRISSWRLYIDGMPYEYGAPSMLDKGLLYLWLPSEYSKKPDEQGSKIEVRLNYLANNEDGTLKEIVLEPLYVEELGGSDGSELRRYIDLSTDSTQLEGPALQILKSYFGSLDKWYDGKALPVIDVAKNPISTKGLESGEGKILDDPAKLSSSFQTIGDDEDEPIAAGNEMPKNSGVQKIEIASSQYKQDSGSYWGHRIIGKAVISPVTSRSSIELDAANAIEVEGQKYQYPTWVQDEGNHNVVTNNHLVVPVDVTSHKLPFGNTYPNKSDMSAVTCEAPTGILQLYIDGVAVPERFNGTMKITGFNEEGKALNGSSTLDNAFVRTDASDGNRAHTMAYFDLNRRQINAFFSTSDYRDNHKTVLDQNGESGHEVLVTYTSTTLPEDRLTLREGAELQTLDAGTDAQKQFSAGLDGVQPKYTDYAYVNYYESQTQRSVVRIQMADPDLTVYNLKGGALLDDEAKPVKGEDGTSLSAPAWTGTAADLLGLGEEGGEPYMAGFVTIDPDTDTRVEQHKSYRYEISDFRTGEDGVTKDDFIPMLLTTNSIGKITITSSNPGVLSFEPATVNNEYSPDAETYETEFKAHVNSAGVTNVTVHVAQAGSLNPATRTFTVYVYPDLATPPVLKVVESSHNTTRHDGTIRPNDTIEYTAVMKNTVADTALFNPEMTITIPGDTTLQKLTAIDPEGNQVEVSVEPQVNPDGSKTYVYKPEGVLYGGSEWKLVAETKVNPDTALKNARGEKLNFTSEAKVTGVYGINPDAFSWDTRIDAAQGVKVAEAVDSADPTTARPNVKLPIIEEILGGEITQVIPDPKPGKPEVVIGNVDPESPMGTAEQPGEPDPTPAPLKPGDKIIKFGEKEDPETPEDIAEQVKKAIDDVLKENEGKPEGEKITEVKIPVIVQRTDPQHPDDPPSIIETVVTIPITDNILDPKPGTPDDPENPDDPSNPGDDPENPDDPSMKPSDPGSGPDDYDLKFLPTDPQLPGDKDDPKPGPGGDQPGGDPEDPDDPSNPGDDPENPGDNPGGDQPGDTPGGDQPGDTPGGDQPGGDTPGDIASDITVDKTVKNVTEGFNKRKNTYALVGDVLEYTITVENKNLGSAWLAAKIYDPLPAGVEYIEGTAIVHNGVTGLSTLVTPIANEDGTSPSKLGFKIGDVYGGADPTTVTFRVKVTPDAVVDGAPVPENLAFAHGTKPSETIVYPEGTDPDGYDPGSDDPIEIVLPDPTPGTFDPEDEGEKDIWEEKADTDNPGPKTPEPARPDGTSHTDPDHAKFSTDKSATVIAAADDPEGEELEDREEGVLYVGDTVRYEITFTNHDEPWTAWYDVTVYDKLPEGMVPVPGTFRLTAPGQTESVAIDDSVYNAEDHDVAVWIGRVLGGETAVLSFDCIVSEAALDSDVGNTATVAGTDPSATDPSVLDGDPEAVPGIGKRTPKPAKGWESFFEERGASFSQTAYPDGNADIRVVDPGAQGGQPAPAPLPEDPDGPSDGVGGDGNGGLAAGNGQSGLGDGGQGLAKTGDAAPIAALVVLALAAAGALGFGLVRKRRRS